jgi:hypothetical protein
LPFQWAVGSKQWAAYGVNSTSKIYDPAKPDPPDTEFSTQTICAALQQTQHKVISSNLVLIGDFVRGKGQ